MAVSNMGSNGKGKSFTKGEKQAKNKGISIRSTEHSQLVAFQQQMEEYMLKKKYPILRQCPAFFVVAFICIVLLSFMSDALAADLVFGLDTAPDRLIPIKIKNPQTFPVSMQIFQGLFDLDEKGKVVPRIVERWETKDFQTWKFYVRRGVLFHASSIFEKGSRQVTAKDVLYSLTRFCSTDSYNAFLLTDSVKGAAEYNQGKANEVSGIRLVDEYAVQIELLRPEPFFINRLSTALISIFPKEAESKEYAERVGLSMAIGTGPYRLDSRTETEILLKKNGNYWDRKNLPQFDKIIFRVINNDQTRLVNLRRGNIDMMVLPNSLFSTVFNENGSLKEPYKQKYQVKAAATFNTHFIGFNNKLVKDENLRRAMFWGTNRKEMIDSILYGYADQTGGTVPPGLNGYEPKFSKNIYDLEKAKAFLNKSTYKGEVLELLVHDIANSEQIGQIFQAQMRRLGVNIVLKKMDFGSVINQMVKGESQLFSMFFEYVFSSPEPILINIFSSSKIPVPNFFQFSNSEVDKMFENLYDMKNERDSVDYCAKIESRIMDDVPAIFLYRQRYVILYPKGMSGLEVSGNNHYFLEKVRLNR